MIWIVLDNLGIIILAILADIIDNKEEFRVAFGADPLIQAVEHEQHAHDCLDGAVSDAMSCIWHYAEDQGAYPLIRVVKPRAQIFNGLDHYSFVVSLCIWVIQTGRVDQSQWTNGSLFDTLCNRLE